MFVKPDTLIGWHRRGFKLYWRRKSHARQGRPPIPSETTALVEEMAINNRTWRAKWIQGELIKLGIQVSTETVKKYMRQARRGLLPPRRRTELGDFPGQSRWRDLGLRFRASLRCVLSGDIRVFHHRVRLTPGGAV